jgi:DNA polymerase sigma
MATEQTFQQMKQLVHRVLPNAEVYLFGSRANNSAYQESDWDLLILEDGEVNKELKNKVFDVLYPYGVEIRSFIHFILANKKEWETHPRFYSLQLSINQNPVMT